jgi:hypothetical protein
VKARKRSQEKAMRTSISMPPVVFIKAMERQRTYGFPTFSDYLQHLLRADARKKEAA